MAKDVIIALDFDSSEKTLKFLEKFEEKMYLKIGMELLYREGLDVVREIKKMGHKIFLDLKLHDIPNTVAHATKSLISLDVDMINFHIAGGSQMLSQAVKVIEDSNEEVIPIGVTILTSMAEDQIHSELQIAETMSLNELVLDYAKLGKNSGLKGVVCSALEVPEIKRQLGEDFLTVTPGIRLAEDSKDDQKRVVTPKDARELGSDYIVVGRSITKSEDPVESYHKIKKMFLGE
ncbi:orotidine-5'-phosphate decarboxylase [Anaerosphaera aminiphila DSM 21120]|uniref:Orotidine 5'-phosphate decarboxylase n=1 Tax=Anaerosphaera aminiphila DSM 21120 TaxID=1120995 RepID=A0A1M5S0K2_9FIRM|nr:orotidine-5'-phosphate decarboxylase [Anaerosphaera aminiphila]SHH31996.1 orotidine-5'-phosphate decarboxylase [Anaerosphaera aminiphila DSM 21120]